MKNELKELDVDFIGGQEPLTKEEEFAISTFLIANKEKRQRQTIRMAEAARANSKSTQSA